MEKSNDLFLSASSCEKLKLFEKIRKMKIQEMSDNNQLDAFKKQNFQISEVNLRQIAMQMHKSYGSIYNTFGGIHDDLKQLLNKDDLTTSEMFQVTPDYYHYFLASNTDAYRFINTVLNQEDYSFSQFCRDVGNSKATELRHLQAMRSYLKQFKIRISYEPMRFIGTEEVIQMVATSLYWESTRGYGWPFKKLRKESISEFADYCLDEFEMVKLNRVTKEYYMLELAVNILRSEAGHLIHNKNLLKLVSAPFTSILKENYVEKSQKQSDKQADIDKIIGVFAELSNDDRIIETAYLYVIFNCAPSLATYNEEEINQQLDELKKHESLIFSLTAKMIEQMPFDLKERLQPDSNRFKVFEINLARIIIGSLAFNENYAKIVGFYSGSNLGVKTVDMPEYKKGIENQLQHLTLEEEYSSLANKIGLLTDAIYEASLRMMLLASGRFSVNVYLDVEDNFLIYMDLAELMQDISYVNLVSDPAKADLAVVSNIQLKDSRISDDVYIFNWATDVSNTKYGSLLTLIRDIWTKKKISK